MFRVTVSLRQPHGQLVPATVRIGDSNGDNNLIMPFTALRVAPDGVRVAIIIGGDELTFGAISGQQGSSPRITLSQVRAEPAEQRHRSSPGLPGTARTTSSRSPSRAPPRPSTR